MRTYEALLDTLTKKFVYVGADVFEGTSNRLGAVVAIVSQGSNYVTIVRASDGPYVRCFTSQLVRTSD